ncbi:MAG: hypothetical protein ACTSRP_16760 [Candidatus Helarchaeota archaeon]
MINELSVKRILKNKLLFFPIFVFIILSFVFKISCFNLTFSNDITLYGTDTPEDTTDYSGVEVMIFKPVKIDTALTNLNHQYPGVRIEVNQRLEFFCGENIPIEKTTTDKNEHWEIKVTGS